jgi:hypothetical protein
MSTLTQELPTSTAPMERRFYSRVAPHAPVYLAIDGNNSLLLNVSENGLLVSTPAALQCNFVARIDIPLTGLPIPVQVNIRVVWANEVRKLAGIQLLDLSYHDREQIRKWGSRESTPFLHRNLDAVRAAPSPSANSSATPAVAPPLAQSPLAQNTTVNKPSPTASMVSPPTTRVSSSIAREVTTSPAARIVLWGMAIVAIFLAASFILKTVAGSSFAHSKEILRRSSAEASPSPEIPETPAQTFRPSPPHLDPSYSYVAAHAGPPPPTLDPAKSKRAASSVPASPDSTHAKEGAAQIADSAIGETPGTSSFDNAANHPDTAANSLSATTESLSEKPLAPLSPPVANTRSESQNIPARNPVNSAATDSASKSNSALRDTATSAAQPSDAAPRSLTAFANSSPFSRTTTSTTPETPPVSTNPPAANAPLSNPTRNPARLDNSSAPAAPAAIPTRPSSTPSAASIAPRNYTAPAIQPAIQMGIQMDTPERPTMEIHLQSGYHASFFNLPGERILESSSVTTQIQRSVRMPANRALWPFNRNKKVVIGGLMWRVDPQVAQNQIRSADIVRVTATVGQDGRVESVKPIHGSANLLPNVLKAVQQWRYQPTLIDGKPVETQCDVLFQFHAPLDRRARR